MLVAQVTALGGKPGVIIPDCEEVLEHTVKPDWSELVLATDGLWDIVAPQELPQVRKQYLNDLHVLSLSRNLAQLFFWSS